MKTYKLPKEFAEKWVSALRSGKYKQTSDSLIKFSDTTNEKSYCCLGVAGSICGLKSKTLLKHRLSDLYGNILPIKKDIGDLKINEDFNQTLINLNDSGKSFTEIADWIESNVEFI